MAIVNKTDPLADQWAARHNAKETTTRMVSADDIAFATGEYTEFDDVMDYLDERERRFSGKPNSYRAEGKDAETESDLIGAACHGGKWGERAAQQLRTLGYTISEDESEFARHRREWEKFRNTDFETD